MPNSSTLVAIGTQDGHTHVIEAASPTNRFVVAPWKVWDHENAVVAFLPDTSVLAIGSTDGLTTFWNVRSDEKSRSTSWGHAGWVTSLAVAPKGKVLASGSLDTTVRIWDTESGEERAVLTGHDAAVSSVAFSPSGQILASGSHDGIIRLWRAATAKEVEAAGEWWK